MHPYCYHCNSSDFTSGIVQIPIKHKNIEIQIRSNAFICTQCNKYQLTHRQLEEYMNNSFVEYQRMKRN